nr:lysophospholipid acyltransferase family protein [Pseudodesulfovibrio sp.]
MKRWDSTSVASSFHHQIFYWAIRVGRRPLAYCMLAFVVFWYTLLPKVRRRSYPYIKRRFPDVGGIRGWLIAYRLNFSFGLNLVDRAAFGIHNDTDFTADEEDKRKIRGLVAEGNGAIMLTAHVGSWQTALAALDFLDQPRSVVLHRAEHDVDHHYFEHREDGCPITIIDPMGPLGGSLEMLDVLRRGEILCLSGDRVLGSEKNTVVSDFLGDPINLPMSVYRLASLTGAPVLVVFSRRVEGKRTHIWVEQVVTVPAGLPQASETYAPFAQKFASALERYVYAHPFQYYNFFNIWDDKK